MGKWIFLRKVYLMFWEYSAEQFIGTGKPVAEGLQIGYYGNQIDYMVNMIFPMRSFLGSGRPEPPKLLSGRRYWCTRATSTPLSST